MQSGFQGIRMKSSRKCGEELSWRGRFWEKFPHSVGTHARNHRGSSDHKKEGRDRGITCQEVLGDPFNEFCLLKKEQARDRQRGSEQQKLDASNWPLTLKSPLSDSGVVSVCSNKLWHVVWMSAGNFRITLCFKIYFLSLVGVRQNWNSLL